MIKSFAALWSQTTVTLTSTKTRLTIACACILGTLCPCPVVFGGPDPGVTNGNAVFYTGNQSQGVILNVSSSSPATLVVSNLTPGIPIAPATGVSGVQIGGSDTTRNLTAIL